MAMLPRSIYRGNLLDSSGRSVVHISDGSNNSVLISPTSTVVFRGEEKTIQQIYDYIKELEDALAEACLMSKEE